MGLGEGVVEHEAAEGRLYEMSEPQTTDTFADAQGRYYIASAEVPEVAYRRHLEVLERLELLESDYADNS